MGVMRLDTGSLEVVALIQEPEIGQRNRIKDLRGASGSWLRVPLEDSVD